MNPETKQINKDVIRSHNEVMLVIGVAEPENGITESQAEAARKHQQYEEDIGHTLLKVGRVVEAAGAWGVNGVRHRILVSNSWFQGYMLPSIYLQHQSCINVMPMSHSINFSSMNGASGR